MRRDAADAVGRAREAFSVGGRRPVLEALRSGAARRVLVAHGAETTEGLREVLQEAETRGIRVDRVDRAELDVLRLGDHHGVAALVDPPKELDETDLDGLGLGPDSLLVVLDGITDPQNLGACARSAEAAGVAALIARHRRAAPLTPAAVRASAGALLHLPLVRVTNVARAVEGLRDRGFTVVGLDQRAEVSMHEAPDPERPLALVLGDEGAGISRLVRESCDLLVRIPLSGHVGSLNAAAALAAALVRLRPATGPERASRPALR